MAACFHEPSKTELQVSLFMQFATALRIYSVDPSVQLFVLKLIMNRQVISVPIFVNKMDKMTLTANATSSKPDANVDSFFPLVIVTGNHVIVTRKEGLKGRGPRKAFNQKEQKFITVLKTCALK